MAALLGLLQYLPMLLQVLPSVISFTEQLHGPGNGDAKKAAAVDIIKTVMPEIAPHLTKDPEKLEAVNGLIDVAVKYMNKNGTMPPASLIGPAQG